MTDAPIQNTIIENDISTVHFIEPDIICVYYRANSIIEPEDFDQAYATIMKLTDGKAIKVVSDIGKYSSVSPEGRKHANSIKINAKAEAVIFHNLAQRLLIRFYLLVRKNEHPFRIFQSVEEALEWMKTID